MKEQHRDINLVKSGIVKLVHANMPVGKIGRIKPKALNIVDKIKLEIPKLEEWYSVLVQSENRFCKNQEERAKQLKQDGKL